MNECEDSEDANKRSQVSFLFSLISLLISLASLGISGCLLFEEHLKAFDLKIEEGAAITIQKDFTNDKYLVGVPMILINNGAQGGVIKKFDLRIKKDNQYQQPDVGHIHIQFKNVLDLNDTQDSIPVVYLKGHGTRLLNVGRHLNELTPGQYDCELIVITPNNQKTFKSFSFKIDGKRISDVENPNLAPQQMIF